MTVFALVDCNNFFASCERAFNPALEKKPIVILSNNDGCIISRSNEAKKLGIPMGGPYYQWKSFCEKNKVAVLSSNFELYGDISYRIMRALGEFCPYLEIYSIDEAFLHLEQVKPEDLEAYALMLSQNIRAWTGVPISIGLAPTKTLAKVANHFAKKMGTGVFNFCDPLLREILLADYPVEELWGVGRRLAPKLKALNIHTAKALRDAPVKLLRKKFSVVMERMIQELQGSSCLALEVVESQKQICSSRSFGKLVTSLAELEEALSTYTAKAARKLRSAQSVACGVSAFVQTSFYSSVNPRYANGHALYFATPTADTRELIKGAKACLKAIYRPGFRYNKTGVILMDLLPNTSCQGDFFAPKSDFKSATLMSLADEINARWGKKALFFCAEGIKQEWLVRCELRSKRYTTKWEELLELRLGL